MGRFVAICVVLVILVACSNPGAVPPRPQPPAVNLTGTWQVTLEFEGIVFSPFIWVIAQSDSKITVYSPGSGATTIPCGEGKESIVGDKWTGYLSFNPSNCPTGYGGFQSGSASVNARVSYTEFGGSITITVTSPAHLAGTYKGSIRGYRLE